MPFPIPRISRFYWPEKPGSFNSKMDLLISEIFFGMGKFSSQKIQRRNSKTNQIGFYNRTSM
ncbi:hypothetical protein [Leptospira kirschneri]|uniref:hypothetical protein n=1 Tax=Leptospira kirschneri TaxID=29507 RepID=UPI0004A2A481